MQVHSLSLIVDMEDIAIAEQSAVTMHTNGSISYVFGKSFIIKDLITDLVFAANYVIKSMGGNGRSFQAMRLSKRCGLLFT